ncbi:hypothetical protein BS78_10G143600 [Paspalum vaginatum]|nr:hypothetical protein BS78_10G143600 [Paspalum vaginatum]
MAVGACRRCPICNLVSGVVALWTAVGALHISAVRGSRAPGTGPHRRHARCTGPPPLHPHRFVYHQSPLDSA